MLAAGLRRSFSQTRAALARGSRAASTGSSYAPVQRRAVPKQLESALEQDEAPPRSREVRSVAEMHVAHCHSLASRPPADGTADATWNWAGLRACKLAEVMTPRDLAGCAGAFALAERRDFRVFYLLAEEAIGKAKTFGPEEAAKMLQAYADVRVRNEPLFESLGAQLLRLQEEEPSSVSEAMHLAASAHETLTLTSLPAYSGLRAAAQRSQSAPKADKQTADEDVQEEEKKLTPEGELAEVLQIISEIVTSGEKLKGHVKNLTKELITEKLSFDESYKRLKEVQPDDVLERYGLTLQQFDALLERHWTNPKVKEGIHPIVGMPVTTDGTAEVPVDKVIEVHKYMLEEVDKVIQQFESLQSQATYDVQIATFTLHAMVAAKVEEKFDLTAQDIEHSVVRYHAELATNKEFTSVNMPLQNAMSYFHERFLDALC